MSWILEVTNNNRTLIFTNEDENAEIKSFTISDVEIPNRRKLTIICADSFLENIAGQCEIQSISKTINSPATTL